jgi:hypothetical protein
MASAAILMVGMVSSIYLAARAADSPETLTAVQDASAIVYDLTDELQHAIYITARSETMIQFVLSDINGDAQPDVLRYEWSGAPGAPLVRTVNGAAHDLVNNVQEFALEYGVRDKAEQFEGPLFESGETVLAELASVSSANDYDVKLDKWVGQLFTPTLPANTLSWKVSKVGLQTRAKSPNNGQFKVQLRSATGTGTPTSDVVAEATVSESDLNGAYGWYEYAFPDFASRLPSENLCLVVRQTSGDVACQAKYEGGNVKLANHGLLESSNLGATWKRTNDKGMWFRVKGTYITPPLGPHTVNRRYATGVRVSLRTGTSGDSRIVSQIPLLNTPELLSGYWKLDFDQDPLNSDANFDAAPDWDETNGSNTFLPGRLQNGVWRAQASDNIALRTLPNTDFDKLTTLELRCRNTTYHASGHGAHLLLNLDRQGSTHGAVFTSVRKELNGAQTARVYALTGPSTQTVLAEATGLSSDFVEFRLVIDPSADVVAVWINGVYQKTAKYVRFHGNTDKFLSLQASQSNAEFDYVSIRVGDE